MSIVPLNSQIVKLARDVADADINNGALLLLQLRDIIDSNHKEKEITLKEIWKYDLPNKVAEALNQDFKLITGTWITACKLCNIAVDCCYFSTTNLQKLKKEYIPNLTYTMLNICKIIVEEYHTSGEVLKSGFSGNLSWVITSITNLMESFVFVSVLVISSKHFMQLLMIEDSRLSLLSLALLNNIIQTNCDVFYHSSESRMHSVADELAFKISSTRDIKVARLSISILLNLIRMYTTLLELFITKRYRGFKMYLNKWKGNGFDDNIESIVTIIDERLKKMQASQVHDNAAIVIQSSYRSYRTRKKLKNASKAISKFQRSYRRKIEEKRLREEQMKYEKMKTSYQEKRRRDEFVKTRAKQLKVIEGIPAKTVNKFFDSLQDESARKIQAAWHGWKTRHVLKEVAPHLKKYKAAVLIQRQIRRWLARCRKLKKEARLDMLPEGLTDERRVELQNVITNIREKFPKSDVTDQELYISHEKANRMLNNHVIGLRAMRRRDEHRKALIGQLSIQSDQMSRMPAFGIVNDDVIQQYSSRSTPVMVAARKKHVDCIRELTLPWWQKLARKTPTSAGEAGDKHSVIFSRYLQEEEKNF